MHLPHTIKRGTTVTMSLWYMQNSTDNQTVSQYAFSAWNTAGNASGLTMMFMDPSTGKWTKSLFERPNDFVLVPQGKQWPLIRPNTVSHVTLRIAISKTARLGTWRTHSQVTGYSLLTKQGTYDNAYLNMVVNDGYAFNVVK